MIRRPPRMTRTGTHLPCTTLFRSPGAKYFMALGCHHDNLDAFDSAHHAWNATRVGPRRDIVGTWEKAVRRAGLRFGISNHSSHARSEEHTSELQSLMRISYAVFFLI